MAIETIDRTEAGRVDTRASSGRTRRESNLPGGLSPEQVAFGLGWFSIGLGLAEIFSPSLIKTLTGSEKRHPILTRVLGAREIAAGIMIFAGARTAGCWSRVAGDAMDLALLGATIAKPRANRAAAIGSTVAVAGVTVADAMTAWELSRTRSGAYDVRMERAITINKPPEECYSFWRNFQNLPRFMHHLESVSPAGAQDRSHWVARGPGGARIEWDAVITADRPNDCISWRSLEGASIDHSGSVHFDRAPGNRGTIVRVTLYYSPPVGGAGAAVAKLFGKAPEEAIANDLRRFKQVLETGEAITTEGQPSGRASGASWLDKLARI